MTARVPTFNLNSTEAVSGGMKEEKKKSTTNSSKVYLTECSSSLYQKYNYHVFSLSKDETRIEMYMQCTSIVDDPILIPVYRYKASVDIPGVGYLQKE